MIIDAYAHGLHGGYLKRLEEVGGLWTKRLIEMEQKRAADRPQLLDVPLRLQLLDHAGIDMQVVTPTNFWNIDRYPGTANERLAVTRELNDNMARIMYDSRGKLPAVASMTLLEFGEDHLREIERTIKGLGLKGVCIQSNINGKAPDLPEFETFWSEAAALDIPVWIHPQDPLNCGGRPYEAEYDLIHNFGWPFETVLVLSRLVFSGVMERYPTLKVVSHHLGGGMVPFFWCRTLETYAPEKQQGLIGRKMPKPLYDYFSLFYYDTAVGGNASAVRCTYDVFGSTRMVFATDFPFGPGGGINRLESYPAVIKSLGLPGKDSQRILEHNTRELLKLG